MSLPYRPNVGIALFNAQGLVFAGRSHSAGPEIVLPGFDWQMPQGGIDPDEDIVAAGYAPEVVERVLRLVRISEWKRHQAAPGPKVSRRAFGRERRYPISNGYRD